MADQPTGPPPPLDLAAEDDQTVELEPSSTFLDFTSFQLHDLDSVPRYQIWSQTLKRGKKTSGNYPELPEIFHTYIPRNTRKLFSGNYPKITRKTIPSIPRHSTYACPLIIIIRKSIKFTFIPCVG